MLRFLLMLTLAAGVAQGQSANTNQNSQAAQKSYVAPTDAIITIHGLCADTHKAASSADPDSCVTVVTRKEFDALLDVTKDPTNPTPRASLPFLARRYAEYLTFERAGKHAGTDKEEGFLILMRLAYLSRLETWYQHDLEQHVVPPTEQEIEAYYRQNMAEYEEASVHRIFIPFTDPNSNAQEFAKKARAVADEMHDRAAKGEDPDVLEKEIDAELGLNYPPMRTDIGPRRKSSFPKPIDEDVFALSPGQVTRVEEEQSQGYAIYRLDSKQTYALGAVRDQIVSELESQKVANEMNAVRDSVKVDLNNLYFNPAAAPPAAPPPAPAKGKP